MHPPLRIEVPDHFHATTLRRRLSPSALAVAVDDHYEVQVELIDRNPDSRVTGALHAIDTWLLTAGLPSVQIHLDGSTYSLHAPSGSDTNGTHDDRPISAGLPASAL